jgi:hypothetical protein
MWFGSFGSEGKVRLRNYVITGPSSALELDRKMGLLFHSNVQLQSISYIDESFQNFQEDNDIPQVLSQRINQ